VEVSPEALTVLRNFPWPGNIRQLENMVQQAVLLSSGPELLLEHLPEAVRAGQPPPDRRERGNGQEHPAGESLRHSRQAVERSLIQRALANNDYNRTRAARALGISRVTLHKKLKKYGLTREPWGDGEAE